MKHLKFSFYLCVFFVAFLSAQTKQITLEDIWNGSFRTESMDVLHSMANGKQYAVLNFNRDTRSTSIDVYDYKTLKKEKTLVDSKDIEALRYFTDYTFSNDETKVILATNETSVYRRSVLGNYFVYDLKTKSITPVFEEKIQQPTFSPDGAKVGYAYKNNLYVKDLNSGKTTQITFDGEKNKIINGLTDWVYEEEFAFVRAFEWNSNSDKIAFIRFDETLVPEFSMDIYGQDLYQTQEVFKYPKAGEPNSKVSLHIYNLDTNKTTKVAVEKLYNDFYIPRIKWTNNSNVLSAQYLNRKQNVLDLWFVNAKTNKANLVLTETDKAYVNVTDNLTFLKDNSFIWTSEKDGYNHIYHYSDTGKLINQVTFGNWEVTNYYGYDEKTDRIFYQSVENGSINRDVYAIKLNGRNKKRLSSAEGTNDAAFSADFSYFINTFSNASTPPQYTLNNAVSGAVIKNIVNNEALVLKLSEYKFSKKEFSTIQVNGNDLNMWMIKPIDFDASKQYPLFMCQYSGPGSQEVANQWNSANDYWYQYLAQQGCIVVCVDGRGTGFKGAVFKKVTQNELGKYEVEDQIEAAKQLGNLPFVDASRIGIWGWSFGGFMSSNCLFKGADVFKMAIAVAPVSSWRFYDSVYTERFMGMPQDNASGYDDNSPINHADKLNGDFLLIHGSGDDNVHVQNTMRLVEALVQANKQFDWAIYPDKNHGIYGGNTRLHLYKKMTNFINEKLGDKTN
ncbi:S9 family peptidase [Siansivirga zeaxanthinifaciens]|uniref:Peptidase S9 n=1 Tax=Siansivirga zeaxanthinifaciens CC-SAMT-1 TaxID=1454006 RepID=A0A0C5W7W0_9FLAO|nr:S9 family peptidase [Siansivirga zeaxanthinifaciens]AJR02302.1 peptidase S9 [Siansivirga zeaxanthinifaciens CC-SAMT-1]